MTISYFNISWLSNEDGPGKRLVIFLQGCNLDCPWCHSPHSKGKTSPLLFFDNLCSACGSCVSACPSRLHSFTNNKHQINRKHCKLCGKCIKACPNSNEEGGALKLPTKTEKVNYLYQYIRPQLLLLKKIGGITISGGEPLLQTKAVKLLLEYCKRDSIHTAVETSGIIAVENFKQIINFVDCWLLGFRLTSEKKELNSSYQLSLRKTLLFLRTSTKAKLIARIPIIPFYTDFTEYYSRLNELFAEFDINEIELLPYNIHTCHYYQAMGIPFEDDQLVNLSSSKYNEAKKIFQHKIKSYENNLQ